MSIEVARIAARLVCLHQACRCDEIFTAGLLLAGGLLGVLASLWLGPLDPLR